MPFTGILFVAVGMVCMLGLLAALVQPAWFRFNGRVPARWKIARLWLGLGAVCAIFALVHREAKPVAVEWIVPITSTSEAVPTDIAVPSAEALDATDGLIDAAADAVEPAPSPAPPTVSQRRPSR